MLPSLRRITILLAFPLAIVALRPAAAQGDLQEDIPPPSGYLVAFACGSLPKSPDMEVEAQDDSPEFKHLKHVFVVALEGQKVKIAPSALLRASLYVVTERDAERFPRGDHSFPVPNPNPASRSAFFSLWSNNRSSIFGGPRLPTLSIDQLRVSVSVTDTSNGRCIWQGEAMHTIGDRNEFVIAEHLVKALAKKLGKTSNAEPISLE